MSESEHCAGLHCGHSHCLLIDFAVFMLPDHEARFCCNSELCLQEIEILKSLSFDRSIVQFYGTCPWQGKTMLVLEHMEVSSCHLIHHPSPCHKTRTFDAANGLASLLQAAFGPYRLSCICCMSSFYASNFTVWRTSPLP